MQDALLFSGILLVIVLVTQVGRRRLHVIHVAVQFAGVGGIGFGYLSDLTMTGPNLVTALLGTAIGIAAGIGLAVTMTVVRDAQGRTYTIAGLSYLSVWLVILLGRLAFMVAVDNVSSFRMNFGKFLLTNHIDNAAVAAFFVLMALSMILVRTIAVLYKRGQASPVDLRSAGVPQVG